MEVGLGRLINPETVGKERVQYQRAIILALRELMGQSEVDSKTCDLAAFIVLMLEAIDESIDQSVAAWEKRGYWIKADRFRQDWRWAGNLGSRMRSAVSSGDWAEVGTVSALIFNKLSNVKVPIRHGLGIPWVGAWNKFSRKP
jgi:hypothetical protein